MLLSAEGRANLEHPLEPAEHSELLVQLRALREVGIGLEVLHREQVGAALGCSGNDLRGVDFLEALGNEVIAAILQYLSSQLEHRVHMGPPQVEVTVVQSDIESHMDLVSHTYR